MADILWLVPLGLICGWLINYLADVMPVRRRFVTAILFEVRDSGYLG